MQLEGVVSRPLTTGRRHVGSSGPLPLDWSGSVAQNSVLGPKALRAAASSRFAAVIGNGATFLAPVTAYPTTTLTMALYNPHDSGMVYFVDQVFVFLASGTPGAGGAILACATAVQQARPTLSTGANGGYASTVISCLTSGRGAPGDTQGIFINAITLTGPQPAWVVLAGADASGTGATIATHAEIAEVGGGIAVTPGNMMGLTYLSGAGTTPLYGYGVVWDEMAADVE